VKEALRPSNAKRLYGREKHRKRNEWKGIYVPFNALLGYIGTATSEGMKW